MDTAPPRRAVAAALVRFTTQCADRRGNRAVIGLPDFSLAQSHALTLRLRITVTSQEWPSFWCASPCHKMLLNR